MTRSLAAFLYIASALVTACSAPASVTNPISEPAMISYDERLPGTWIAYGTEDGDTVMVVSLIIQEAEDEALYVIYDSGESEMYGGRSRQKRYWGKWKAHASIIDGRTYYSGQLLDARSFSKSDREDADTLEFDDLTALEEPVYQLSWAEITDAGNLVLHVMHENDLKGRGLVIKGNEANPEEVRGMAFDVSSEQLIELIRNAEPGELFTAQLGPFLPVRKGTPPDFDYPFGIFGK